MRSLQKFRRLEKSFVTSEKLASILDWKSRKGGSLLCLDIREDHIDLAIAHRSRENINQNFSLVTKSLTPLDFSNKTACFDNKISFYNKNQILEDLVNNYSICGFLVGWPLLGSGNGRLGASCGKVLHTLESFLIQDSSSNEVLPSSKEHVDERIKQKKKFGGIISINRPFTLLDTRKARDASVCDDHSSEPDEWGRSVSFSCVPPVNTNVDHYHVFQDCKSSYKTSELDIEKNKISACSLLEQFVKEHWQMSAENSTINHVRKRQNLVTAHRRSYKIANKNKKSNYNEDNIFRQLRDHQSYPIPTGLQMDDAESNIYLSHSLL